MNYLPARVTGKVLLPTINGEAAARGGRVLIWDTDFHRSPQIANDISWIQEHSDLGL